MVKEWVTVSVIAFGVIIAIVGVVAYLRMYKKVAWSSSQAPEAAEQPIESVTDSPALLEPELESAKDRTDKS
ncbi:hypothetical protein [Paenibacillus nasutitermitis]|uniref:Uncharacterized protein n=1 Tax=Paenibacillus nasutitermitis TaxID=1652958 RepID=A0A917E0A8_9BACL|nr:hypothetical protein [Paenibacillus nasutitermitis]GGD87100.1 hypothetical protein GCM10010911_51920 [Paenibacillus nasutitermitis]